jgi:protein-disulfide isomerase
MISLFKKVPEKNKEIFARALLLAGVLLFALSVFFFLRPKSANGGAPANAQLLPNPRPQVQGNAMGNPNAPVTMIEFSDFLCPYCRQFALEIEPLLIEEYVATGKVYFIYRTLGDWLGPESQASAEAAYCAAEQNRFWEYHDLLFANQNLVDFSTQNLLAFAEDLGLNMDQFEDCLQQGEYRPQVEKDLQDGLLAGVRGTPSFLINSRFIAGAQAYAVFQREIEAALNSLKP